MNNNNLTEVDWEIIVGMADNDLNIGKTARNQFRHRQTVLYHIQRIKEKTGLNPQKFYDMIKLLALKDGD